MTLTLSGTEPSSQTGGIVHEQWADLAGNTLGTLTGLAKFPAQPDGVSGISSFELPQVRALGFGGRMRALVTPEQSGDFTFYLSSAGSAELFLSTDATSGGLVSQCSVFSAQTDIPVGNWNTYPNQQSSPVTLTAGESYLLEVRYLAPVERAHCQAAWSGPGLTGIEVLDSTAVSASPFLPKDVPASPVLIRDYDTAGQTGTLWATGTGIVPGVPGMTGNAEQFNADPTTDLVALPTAATEAFYASWVFQMEAGHNEVNLYFRNADTSSQEGPRIDLEESGSNGERAVIRSGGSNGHAIEIEVTYGAPYRVEMVASMVPGGFQYQADLATLTVAEDTFDLYVTDLTGKLIGSARGLAFRDGGVDVVQKIDGIRAASVLTPMIMFDDWEITGGSISGNGYLRANTGGFSPSAGDHYFRIGISDGDQDGDGLSDWEEMQLAEFNNYLFFDAESSTGFADLATAINLLTSATGPIEFSLQASDTAAFERNTPNLTGRSW